MRVGRWRLANAHGEEAWVTNAGAALMRLRVRDARGAPGDVVLGFDEPERYLGRHPHLGAAVGRFANRIAGGRYHLDGIRHRLPCNAPPHHLHGGPAGFGRRVWDAEPFREPGAEGVRFRLASPHGDQGHTGGLRVELTLRLTADSELALAYRVDADRPALVGLSHHAYFHLGDGGASPVLDHRLRVAADAYTPVDATGIPTGALAPVAGTPLDLRRARRLGDVVAALPPERGGIDHNLVLSGADGRLRPVAELAEPRSGRRLALATTLPGLQVYGGQFLDGTLEGRDGVRYARHAGVCLEAQLFPDAPNQPGFPSARVVPGQPWRHATVYRFSASG